MLEITLGTMETAYETNALEGMKRGFNRSSLLCYILEHLLVLVLLTEHNRFSCD